MENYLDNDLPQRSKVLADGSEIVLAYHEEDLSIRFYKNNLEISCNDIFRFELHDEIQDRYLILSMFSPVTKSGLGREALKLFIEETGATLWVRSFDCPEMSDGSNILPDAVPFVEKMICEGWIEDNAELVKDDW